ncbi:phage filamentation protein Fil family protein [Citrobacter freundii]
MLTKEPSFASLLVKQSPSMHYGHGWIAGEHGKRWHPSRSQADLLAGLSTNTQEESWLSKLLNCLRH